MNLNDEINHNKRVLNSRFVASLLECDLIFRGVFVMTCPTWLYRIGIYTSSTRPVHVSYAISNGFVQFLQTSLGFKNAFM
jgi:hypothetical protein